MPGNPTLLSIARTASAGPALTWRLTFSEAVSGVRSQDISITGQGSYAGGAIVQSLTPEGDGLHWLLSIQPGAGEGRIIPTYTGRTIMDLDGNFMVGGTFAAPTAFAVTTATNLAVLDANQDGRLDILADNQILVGDGQGGFAAASASQQAAPVSGVTNSQVFGDLNGDGRLDRVTVNGQSLLVAFGNAQGAYDTPVTYLSGGGSVTLGRINADAALDILVTQSSARTVRLNDGQGGFLQRVDSSSASVTTSQGWVTPLGVGPGSGGLADVNNDGLDDLVATATGPSVESGSTSTRPSELFVGLGKGDGTFETARKLSAQTGTFGTMVDLNGDARLDLVGIGYSRTSFNSAPFFRDNYSVVVSLNQPEPALGEVALNYTAPRASLGNITSPGATLLPGNTTYITVTFDKPVINAGFSQLALNNGKAAGYSSSVSTFDNTTTVFSSTSITYDYTPGFGDAVNSLSIQGIFGLTGRDSGLAVDGSALLGSGAGQKVSALTPLYFLNGDGRVALWALDTFQATEKAIVGQVAPGTKGLAVIESQSTIFSNRDMLFSGTGDTHRLNLTSPISAKVATGFAGTGWTFAGDGASGGDPARVFWHNADGRLAFWDIGPDGLQKASGIVGRVSTDWRPAAIADVTGDRTADVLWQNSDGRVVLWEMLGTAAIRGALIDSVTADWKLVAAGDLNGDGRADLLYRNAGDGRVVARLMDAFTNIGDNQVVGQASTDWSVADLRDMNGDGCEDILWRNLSGDFAVWTMDGAQVLSRQSLDKVSPDWVLLT